MDRNAKAAKATGASKKTLGGEPYSHPGDNNLQIYHEQIIGDNRTEQLEIEFLSRTPGTKSQKRREELALRELARCS